MKKLVLATIISTALFTSCTGGCNTSTVEGASQCLCDLIDESVLIDVNDEAKMNEVLEKSEKINKEIRQAIADGKYTTEELATLAGERGCL